MTTRIYASNRYKKYFAKSTNWQNINADTHIEKINNGIVAINPKNQRFCVFDTNNKPIKNSIPFRNGEKQPIPRLCKTNHYMDLDVVYLGNLEDHFGHFLLEHTNRVYPALQRKFKRLKYVLVNNRQFKKTPDFIWTFFSLLGISRSDIIIVNETTKFKSICVPSPCFNIPNISSAAFKNTFNKIASNIEDETKFDKIYVSRTALEHRKTFGEEKIQNIFRKNGYKIITPEKMPLERQISFMKNCKSLAGIAGSALHLALFMPKGGNVIQIKRNRLPKDNSNTQKLICKTKNLNFILVDAAIEKHRTHHWSEFPQIIGFTKHLKAFLDDNNFKYNESDKDFDKKAYQEYTKLFKFQGGFIRYQFKRIIVKTLPWLIPIKYYRMAFYKWLNRHI